MYSTAQMQFQINIPQFWWASIHIGVNCSNKNIHTFYETIERWDYNYSTAIQEVQLTTQVVIECQLEEYSNMINILVVVYAFGGVREVIDNKRDRKRKRLRIT